MTTIDFLTAVLVLITGFYAWFTHKIMKANQAMVTSAAAQTDQLTRPYVTISPLTVPSNHVLYLRIANTGRTAAQHLRLTLDRDFYQLGRKDGRNLRDLSAFQHSIDCLAPGTEIIFLLAQAFVVFGESADPALTPPVFEISASYRYGHTQVTENTVVDLRPYKFSMDRPDPVVDELERLRKELEKISKHLTVQSR